MLDVTVGADPADEVTKASAGHIPASYRDLLKPDALKNIRVGAVKDMFGALPDDEEVGAIDRRALEEMAKAGATIVDVSFAAIDEQMRLSSVIDAEFKFDLIEYLAHRPGAPVRSLREILDRGDYSAALEANFRRREARTSPDTPDVVQARARRTTLLTDVQRVMREQKLDVLAYPTLRRKAAPIGEPQRGAENCQLSPSTGLPAISMPAGFTSDGVPVGIELLGAAWSEPQLLAMTFAYEQATHPRRPPAITPALANGRAPAALTFVVNLAGAHVTFTFDHRKARWRGTWSPPSRRPSVHRGRAGPAIATISDKATDAAGSVVLSPADREAPRANGCSLWSSTMQRRSRWSTRRSGGGACYQARSSAGLRPANLTTKT
jgi:hypothetical protein